jgi:ribosomal protein L44E
VYPFTNVLLLPQGYTWDDISYVIGGYNWKALFLDKQGYIITHPPDSSGNADYLNQYNLPDPLLGKAGGFVQFHAGEEQLSYDCGACHTTGYSAAGHQESLPGISGTWAEAGVKCEACHGPGSLHASNPGAIAMVIDRQAEACAQCHLRGGDQSLDFEAGFVSHHEQYGGMFLGKHDLLDCVFCHDPHSGVVQLRQAGEQTTETPCGDCHFREAQFQKNARHVALDIDCVQCHMPHTIQSAWADPQTYRGDVRTHVMAINPFQISQTGAAGDPVAAPISLDFACRQCHIQGTASQKGDQELSDMAVDYHARP